VPTNGVMSQLVGAASRDLRQSLQTIRRLQAVLSRPSKDPDYAPHVALLDNALRTMDHVLSSLADINRLETEIAAKLLLSKVLMAEPHARAAIKILHIEDDPSVARSMARLLRLEGYEVASVATRDEAMHHLEVLGLRPDLILTDSQLRMGLTGDELVAEIAARLKFQPPTIMLTSVTAFQRGEANSVADRFLPKPIDISVLLHEIEDLLGARA
jgi:CheY-like chemotaxis protein